MNLYDFLFGVELSLYSDEPVHPIVEVEYDSVHGYFTWVPLKVNEATNELEVLIISKLGYRYSEKGWNLSRVREGLAGDEYAVNGSRTGASAEKYKACMEKITTKFVKLGSSILDLKS